jgi:hypothetical protein
VFFRAPSKGKEGGAGQDALPGRDEALLSHEDPTYTGGKKGKKKKVRKEVIYHLLFIDPCLSLYYLLGPECPNTSAYFH